MSRGRASRFWCFTSFHAKEGFLDFDQDAMEYVIQQEELCPTSGGEHWQGTVVFFIKKRLPALKKYLPSAHWESMRGSLQESIAYCSDVRKRKIDGLFLECGDRPIVGDDARGQATRERYATAYRLAIEGKLRDIEPSMMVRHLRNLVQISTMFGERPRDLDGACPGVWLVGPAGSGKTRLCSQFIHYRKDPGHRWFDGYANESCVVVDDFAPFHIAQTSILKFLGHQYAYQAETKGASIWLRPRCVIITSQYMIHDIWKADSESVDAIKRRYTTFSLPGYQAEAEAYIKGLLAPPIDNGFSEAEIRAQAQEKADIPKEADLP